MTTMTVPAVVRARTGAVYTLMVIVGAGAFLYPFWLPSGALPNEAHAATHHWWLPSSACWPSARSRSRCGAAR